MIKAYRSDLWQMKKYCVERSVKSHQAYFDQLIQRYKLITVMQLYHALIALESELVWSKHLKVNKIQQVRRIIYQQIQQREYHPLEEVIQTIRQITDRTYRLFFELISQTDLRFVEVRLFSIEDIQFASLTLLVRNGKGRRLRMILLVDGLSNKLQVFLWDERRESFFIPFVVKWSTNSRLVLY